jgi:hypothetical protein
MTNPHARDWHEKKQASKIVIGLLPITLPGRPPIEL